MTEGSQKIPLGLGNEKYTSKITLGSKEKSQWKLEICNSMIRKMQHISCKLEKN